MMNWEAPQKPAEAAESRLITAILDGHFSIGTSLPAERELAVQLGVTRPTLREALQRLARDGWIEIRHGRSTRVRNFWQEGSLGVLGALARFPEHAPPDFIPNLLAVRRLLAPAYAEEAVTRAPASVADLLRTLVETTNDPAAFAAADWQLHHRLTILSGNPIFTLILNGFAELYPIMAKAYFGLEEARTHSRRYYEALLDAAEQADGPAAAEITRQVMVDSLALWKKTAS